MDFSVYFCLLLSRYTCYRKYVVALGRMLRMYGGGFGCLKKNLTKKDSFFEKRF